MSTKDEDLKIDIINKKLDELKILIDAKLSAHLSYHAKKLEEENKIAEDSAKNCWNQSIIKDDISFDSYNDVYNSKIEVKQNANVKSSSNKESSGYKRKKVLSL